MTNFQSCRNLGGHLLTEFYGVSGWINTIHEQSHKILHPEYCDSDIDRTYSNRNKENFLRQYLKFLENQS